MASIGHFYFAQIGHYHFAATRLPLRMQHMCASDTSPQMADSVWRPFSASAVPATTVRSRHSAVVRVTHWITTLSFLALLVTVAEILISHPRFYWAEAGNGLTPPLSRL